jgi:hypothetical protein
MAQEERSMIAEWASTVKNLGPVTVGFFLLLFVNVGWLPSPVLTALEKLDRNAREAQARMQDSIKEGQQVIAETQKVLANVQVAISNQAAVRDARQDVLAKGIRQICRNTAKNQQANEKCDEL